jgi:phosphoribosylformylglycinamidine synthase
MRALQRAIAGGKVRACHDLSEGGLAVAIAEMAFSGGLGAQINLAALPVPMHQFSPAVAAILFAEYAGRFLVEVTPENYDAFLRIVKDCPFGELGRVTDTGRIVIQNGAAHPVIDIGIADAKAAWQSTFKM